MPYAHTQELAVMVARSRDGSTKAFPVVETLHKNSILLVTEAPSRVAQRTQQRAQQVAESAVACLDGARSVYVVLWMHCGALCVGTPEGVQRAEKVAGCLFLLEHGELLQTL
jgi:hypothetical protein